MLSGCVPVPPAASVAAALLLCASSAPGQSLTLSVRSQSVERGEAVAVTASLEGAAPRGQPRLALPPGASVVSGPHASTSMHMSGGRTTVATQYSYSIALPGPGRHVLGPARIATERGELASGTASVVVTEAGGGVRARALLSISPSRAYVGQPVVAVFELEFAKDISSYEIRIPFLDELKGLRADDPERLLERWQESEQRTGRGLPGHAALRPSNAKEPVIAAVSSRESDGLPVTVLTVRRVLVPTAAGRVELGRAEAVVSLVVGTRRVRDPFFDSPFFGPSPFSPFTSERAVTKTVTSASEPASLEVLDFPAEGRPDGFEGAVGRYTLTATASPTEVLLGGEPVQLTLTVAGEGNLETVGAPRLADDADFRVGAPEQSVETRFEGSRFVGTKRFVVPVRPNSSRVREIPRARLVVFDPVEEKYRMLEAGPIPLKVVVPKGGGAVESVPLPEAGGGPGGAVKEDIEDIVTGYDPARPDAAWLHRPWALAVFFGLPALAYVALALHARRWRLLRDDAALARRLSAVKTARARLDDLAREAAGLPDGEYAARLSRVLQGYIADRLGRPQGEMSSAEAERLLAEAGFTTECACEAGAVLGDAEAARFARAAAEGFREGWLARVGRCMEAVERESGGRLPFRRR